MYIPIKSSTYSDYNSCVFVMINEKVYLAKILHKYILFNMIEEKSLSNSSVNGANELTLETHTL